MISFWNSYVSPRAIELTNEVLRSGWLSEGKMVERFENALTDTLGLVNPVATNSETSALHLALVLAGVGLGDEVILPAQTFIATGSVILQCGAKPVFADIDPMTGNVTPEAIAESITEKTKAIIVVHWGGYPCDLIPINEIAFDHEVSVIEDAAHALGSEYGGKPIGSGWGMGPHGLASRFVCFSFQAIKHLTAGDGGSLCSQREDAHRAKLLRWFGIDRKEAKPDILGERVFDVKEAGYKYHMNDIAAAIGLGNLEEFPRRLKRRQKIGAIYRAELAHVGGVTLLKSEPDRTHAYWLFTMLVERREDLICKLKENGVPNSVVHLRIDRNSIFGGPFDLPGQAEFEARQLSIPVHDELTDADVHHIVHCFQEGW